MLNTSTPVATGLPVQENQEKESETEQIEQAAARGRFGADGDPELRIPKVLYV